MNAVTILPMQANQGNPFQQADLLDPIEEVLEALHQGQLVIVTDDAQRENEGDLILAAEKATAEAISFMIRYTSGVICVPIVDCS
jgi:3,4-dihydroxy 2-butanone 4-phosphate synthase / GTP cyclohydrolase II